MPQAPRKTAPVGKCPHHKHFSFDDLPSLTSGRNTSGQSTKRSVTNLRDVIFKQDPEAQILLVSSTPIAPISSVIIIDTNVAYDLPVLQNGATHAFMLVEDEEKSLAVAADVCKAYSDTTCAAPALVAVLMKGQAGTSSPADRVASKIAVLVRSGASDATVLPSDSKDVEVAIAVSVARADECRMRNAMFEQEIRKAKKQFNELFWQSAHEIVEGFPQVRTDMQEVSGRSVGNWLFDSQVGKGAFGQVYTCQDKKTLQSNGWAVKVVAKTSVNSLDSVLQIATEQHVLKSMRHPNVVAGHGLLHGRQNIYIFMEMAGTTNLSSLIKGGTMSKAQKNNYFKCIANGLAHCHSVRVAHCDMKPENVVVAHDGCAKIVDFGEAVALDEYVPRLKAARGTMPFMAPEILYLCDSWDPAASDVWALGVSLMELMCGFQALSQILDWPSRCKASSAHADDLVAFFGAFSMDSQNLQRVTTLCDDPPSHAVCDLLVHMMSLAPKDRWPMKEVAQRAMEMS